MTGPEIQELKHQPIVQIAHHEHLASEAYGFNSAAGSKSSMSIKIGRIAKMDEPAGWAAGKEVARLGYIEYHPSSDPLTKLYTFDRGARLGNEDAKAFADVLYKYGPHTLKADELASLQQHGIFRDKGPDSDFMPLMAKTEDINGRRVLVLEGTFKDDNLHVRTAYIDADSKKDGSVIQELTYQAPAPVYLKNLPAARKAVQSILWK
ncbi:MAG TPA: hypothetical protein V6C81_07650 [Planktothrix sp.]